MYWGERVLSFFGGLAGNFFPTIPDQRYGDTCSSLDGSGQTEAVLAEMRTIRSIEHTGKMKVITSFVGSQVA